MTTRSGNRRNEIFAELSAELVELVIIERVQVSGTFDLLEKRHLLLNQTSEHVLQNAAVAVVVGFARGIDAKNCIEHN